MRKISQIKAFEQDFELFEMDGARIIGKAVRSGGRQGKQAELLWHEVLDTPAICAISRSDTGLFSSMAFNLPSPGCSLPSILPNPRAEFNLDFPALHCGACRSVKHR